MTYRLFEGKHHASVYQKYRFRPPQELRDVILQYLDQKKGQPHGLAVDLGCGTGQNSRLLAPHFRELVGLDISECQLEEARAVPGYSNITYRKGTAEELPFPDGSVDLITAASAAHWFDQRRFLSEASRVLKPHGCLALLGFNDDNITIQEGARGDRLTQIYREVKKLLLPFTSNQVSVANNMLQELYAAIPFPDKERVECIRVHHVVSVTALLGFVESWSMFQAYRRHDHRAAEGLLRSAQNRFLEEMGVTSADTELDINMDYYCLLATKPE